MGFSKSLEKCLIECVKVIGHNPETVVCIFWDSEDRKFEMVFNGSKPFTRRVELTARFVLSMRVDYLLIETLCAMKFGNMDLFNSWEK